MLSNFREAPRPNYDHDVRKLIREYERALKSVQAELNTLFLTDFERAQIVAVEENIRAILNELNRFGAGWTRVTLTQAATNGVASTIYSLGLVETFDEAKAIARFNTLNKRFVASIVADTQADLLAVTQNVERKTRSAIRRATAEVLRYQTTRGINATQSLRQALTTDIRKRLGSAADSAIIDAVGRQWKLNTYTEMLVRTKALEAHKEATINEAIEREVYYGVISRHGASDACSYWEGRVVKLSPDAPGSFPYVENLPRREIFHPNCRHTITPVRRLDNLPDDLRVSNEV